MSAWLQVVLFALGARLGFDCDAARARLGSTPLDDGSVFRGLRPLFGPRFRWADSAPVPGSLLSDGSGWAPKGGRLDPPSAGGFSGGVGGRRFREACGGLGCVSMAAPFFAASRPLPDASPRPHPPAARAGLDARLQPERVRHPSGAASVLEGFGYRERGRNGREDRFNRLAA